MENFRFFRRNSNIFHDFNDRIDDGGCHTVIISLAIQADAIASTNSFAAVQGTRNAPDMDNTTGSQRSSWLREKAIIMNPQSPQREKSRSGGNWSGASMLFDPEGHLIALFCVLAFSTNPR
jgi:hypothetical protein